MTASAGCDRSGSEVRRVRGAPALVGAIALALLSGLPAGGVLAQVPSATSANFLSPAEYKAAARLPQNQPAKGRKGYLFVRTNPVGATVTVKPNGARLPVDVKPQDTVEVEAGCASVVVSAPRHVPASGFVCIRPDEVGRVDVALVRSAPLTGKVTVITTPPSAGVSIDGRAVGFSPMTTEDVPEGEHSVSVTLAGASRPAWEGKVVVTGGEVSLVKMDLSAVRAEGPSAAQKPPAAPPPPPPSPVASVPLQGQPPGACDAVCDRYVKHAAPSNLVRSVARQVCQQRCVSGDAAFVRCAWTAETPADAENCGALAESRPTGTPAPAASSSAAPAAPAPGASVISWIPLPGGLVTLEADGAGREAGAGRTAKLAAFELSKTEVTFGQYRKCVTAGWCTPPHLDDQTCRAFDGTKWEWTKGRPDGKFLTDDQPVVCVDWTQAQAFARWVGGRLPTEAEWTFAARGGEAFRTFPWGRERATCLVAVIDEKGGSGCGRGTTWPVCSRTAGNSPQGVCDLVGNVSEWVQDPHLGTKVDVGRDGTPPSAAADAARVIRGDSWFGAAQAERPLRSRAKPDYCSAVLGIRVARAGNAQPKGAAVAEAAPPPSESLFPQPVASRQPAAAASPASGQSAVDVKSQTMQADNLQTASEKFLLLRAMPPRNATRMPEKSFQWLLGSIEQLRFDIQDWPPNSDATRAWCLAGAGEAQIKAGDTTTKGQARVTRDALLKRCSEIATYAFEARHTCKRLEKGGFSCEVFVQIDVTKYTAKERRNGTVEILVDPEFGEGGTLRVESSDSASAKTPEDAIEAASFLARLFAERRVRDIEMFQLRAPIVTHLEPTTSFCLGRDAVELDTPFHVLKPTRTGVERVGFVKARTLRDGCVLTPGLEKTAREEGRKVDLGPSEAEDILGSSDIRAGMTVWEMPSVGLNLGGSTGFGMFLNQELTGMLGFVAEYDLARHTGSSETFVTLGIWAAVGREYRISNQVRAGLGLKDMPQGVGAGMMLTGDMGILKRFYLSGPMFADLGAGFAWGTYLVGKSQNEEKLTVYAFGLDLKLGIGFQLDPRLIMRFQPTFHYMYVGGKIEDGDSQFVGHDPGFSFNLEFLYNI